MGELKLEYCDGVIYAMAGGTRAHAQLSARMIVALHRVLPVTSRLSTSDVKVRVEASDLSTFPDVSVICGEPVASTIDENAITNPTLLVEITSKSTEDYDRGDKLSHYKQIPSLAAVLFVSHRTRKSRSSNVRRTGGKSASFAQARSFHWSRRPPPFPSMTCMTASFWIQRKDARSSRLSRRQVPGRGRTMNDQ